MMADFGVVKLEADKEDAFLIKIVPKDKNKPLDLDLLATDGENAWKGKVRTRSLDKLHAKSYSGSAQEWTAIVTYALRSNLTSGLDDAVKQSLQVHCTIDGKRSRSSLFISFRTLVQDITQQLGSIELSPLPADEIANLEDNELNLFQWTCRLADDRDKVQQDAAEQQEQAGAEAKTVESMQKLLDDLTNAKADHERELMGKFAALLNEKKFQLRRLNQILKSAQVDPKQIERLRKEKSTARRGKKRAAESAENASDEDSEGFENLEVDKNSENGSEQGGQTTEEDTDEDETEDLDQPVPSRKETSSSRSKKTTTTKAKAPDNMPARRELPFTKQKQNTSQEKPTTRSATTDNNDEAETASEDEKDEL